MWGLSIGGGRDQNERFNGLAQILKKENYDVVLLQEVMQLSNYESLLKETSQVLPYHASSLLDSKCSSSDIEERTQENCAGLLILSKHNLENSKFTPYAGMGASNNIGNFEDFNGRGVLEARMKMGSLTVDIFNTHLASLFAEDNGLDNSLLEVRGNQVSTLLERIQASDANIKIFGGDLNAYPIKDDANSPYARMTQDMIDSFVDRYPYQVGNPDFATHGKAGNTYSGKKPDKTVDYLMHWADPSGWTMATADFKIPEYKAINSDGKEVSISDHEPLHAEYLIVPNDQDESKFLSQVQMFRHKRDFFIPSTFQIQATASQILVKMVAFVSTTLMTTPANADHSTMEEIVKLNKEVANHSTKSIRHSLKYWGY